MSELARQLRFRRWYLRFRARLSIPVLLARCDERTIVALVAAVNGTMALLTLIGLAWLVDLPLLFPALGPSAFILFSRPFSRDAAPRSVVVGHFVGITVGCATWWIVSSVTGHPVSLEAGGWPVLVSASIAMAISCMLLIWLRCPHPPGCASALITAFGATHGWLPLLGMAAGVILLTAQAVLISRLAGVNVPLWSPRQRISQPE